MMSNPNALSEAQRRLLLDVTAGRPVGDHDTTKIKALQRRGTVLAPSIDAKDKYLAPTV
jgi:hypothetical protein